jgi:hypothetical protein
LIDPQPNITTHPWYQKRNHVKLPRNAVSKSFIDGAYLSGGGGSGEPQGATWLGQPALWLGQFAIWTPSPSESPQAAKWLGASVTWNGQPATWTPA